MRTPARTARAIICCALLLGLLLHAGAVPIAHAATITVSTTVDELNTDSDCSLREAIRAANLDSAVDGCLAGSGADTIALAQGIYTLAIAGMGEDAALTGDLDIVHDLTITGAGTGATVLDGNQLDRLLDVRGANLHLAHLSIRNGSADSSGGGIANNRGTLTLDDVVIRDNQAPGDGGGIANVGTLALNNSEISGNSSDNSGGGIISQGMLVATSSHIMGNTAFSSGGGIYGRGGTIVLTDTSVMMNTASRGGGITNASGALTVIDSEIMDNMATEVDGGGILNKATLTIRRSLVGDNMAHEGRGGGIFNQAGTGSITASTFSGNMSGNRGGGIANSGTLIVRDTAVVSNSAESHAFPYGYPAFGGGIANSGILTVTNSTVNGNMAFDDGGGIYNQADTPGAARLSLNNVTVADNMADSDGQGGGDGGGIANEPGSLFSLQNTIVASNQNQSSGMGAAGTHDCIGEFISQGYNLIGDRSASLCVGFADGVKGDHAGNDTDGAIDVLLGPLLERGDMPMTDALLDGSPAIDAGNPYGCTDGMGQLLTDDQRGDARPHGRACDIGAYEYNAIEYLFIPFIHS